MGINLVTFAAQTVTPQDDALIYETALQESGMIYGGAVTIKNANVLHVDAGHGALCGRKFTIEATDVPVPLTASGSLQGRIYIHMDLSDTGEPISFQVETASSLTPVIQQADVNINSGIYEINLATFIVDTSTISNLVNVAPFIDIEPDAEFNAQSNNPVQNKVITKAVGIPETIGGLASQEYNIGDRLISSDGQFYDVIAHISPNATIVLNGNVTLGGNIVDLINSLSSQISNLGNYSTTEHSTGKYWVDGKLIYRKVINFGTLPNNTAKRVNHNISGVSNWVYLTGITWTNTNTVMTLPHADIDNSYSVALWCDATAVTIKTGQNRNEFSNCYVTLEYTKT